MSLSAIFFVKLYACFSLAVVYVSPDIVSSMLLHYSTMYTRTLYPNCPGAPRHRQGHPMYTATTTPTLANARGDPLLIASTLTFCSLLTHQAFSCVLAVSMILYSL